MEEVVDIVAELEKDPDLKPFCKQMRTLEELKKVIREETNRVLIIDGFETILKAQEHLYSGILTWHANKNSEKLKHVVETCAASQRKCEVLAGKLRETEKAYESIHDDICLCMLLEPRYTFENVILRTLERKKKIESCDSRRNWQWSYHFPLIARIRMAFKLVFGKKEIKFPIRFDA